VHHALGRNYQQMAYVSGLPGVAHGRTHAFHHWLAALDAKPFLFPGWWLEDPSRHPSWVTLPCRTAAPFRFGATGAIPPCHGMHRLRWRAATTDNDSWSTNELDIDWQGVTLYNLYLARWWAAGATHSIPPSVPDSRK